MHHRRFFGFLVPALVVVLASPVAAQVSDGDLRRAAEDLERARAEAGEAGAALSAGRAETARLRARLQDLAGEMAGAEIRYSAARLEARSRVRALYVSAGDRPAGVGGGVGTTAVVRRTYAAALAERDRAVVNSLAVAALDRERLRGALRGQAREQAELARHLESLSAAAGRALVDAEAEYARVRAAWEAQEAQRRAAVEAAATSTTAGAPSPPVPAETTTSTAAAPTTTTTTAATTTTVPPVEGGPYPPPVERWRPLVGAYFPAALVGEALSIIRCESHGDPAAVNPVSGAAGLFQHMPRYWPDRAAAAGFPGASILDPEANIAGAAWLVEVSMESGLPPWYFWSCQP